MTNQKKSLMIGHSGAILLLGKGRAPKKADNSAYVK